MKYLWDTNTVIYYLQLLFSEDTEKLIDGLLIRQTPVISCITEIELLCWKEATEMDITSMKKFISNAHVIELESEVKLKTIELRKNYRVKLPDCIIAASALVNDLTMITRNTVDFSKIEGLKLLNPYN